MKLLKTTMELNVIFYGSTHSVLQGATIKKEPNGAIVVARIMRGGAADRSGEQ